MTSNCWYSSVGVIYPHAQVLALSSTPLEVIDCDYLSLTLPLMSQVNSRANLSSEVEIWQYTQYDPNEMHLPGK